VADDEDDDDEEQHHGNGVVATLVRGDGVVTLRRVPDRAEDEAVQHDQDLEALVSFRKYIFAKKSWQKMAFFNSK
jgi:hypothetical protein